MWDTSIMHYVNFLMAHGMAPYRDIIDINMPGSYFIEGWAMHVFGGGDLGWRLYDFSLLGLLIASLIVISLPYDWFAGLFAGVVFILIHGLEGPRNAVQRDETMIVLIMIGHAFLFTSMRRRKPLLMLPFGLAMGLAASLKPTAAPLGLILLLMAALALHKKGLTPKPYLIYGVTGLVVAFSINLEFLLRYHAFGDFIAVGRRLIPYYMALSNQSAPFLIGYLLQRRTLVPLAIALVLAVINKTQTEWENWERLALGLGLLFGAASFVAQGKPFPYHAYPFKVFVLLLFALEATKAMRTMGWRHVAGLAAIVFLFLEIVPDYTRRMAFVAPLNDQQDAIAADLIRLGGPALQKQVQCLDMVDGCNSALYQLRLVQSTGFIGDYMFFPPSNIPPPPHYRDMLWDHLHKDPPKVIVFTDMDKDYSLDRLNRWPQLAAYIHTAYFLDVARTFPDHRGYEIFVLKDPKRSAQPHPDRSRASPGSSG